MPDRKLILQDGMPMSCSVHNTLVYDVGGGRVECIHCEIAVKEAAKARKKARADH